MISGGETFCTLATAVFLVLKSFLSHSGCTQAGKQTNGELNRKCQVIYAGGYGVANYHPLIPPWKNITCVIKEKSKFITIGGKENTSLWFRLKSSLLDRVSALAGCSNACFLFGLSPGWILNHLGVVRKGCGAPVTGWFSHLKSQRDIGNMLMFKRPTKF